MLTSAFRHSEYARYVFWKMPGPFLHIRDTCYSTNRIRFVHAKKFDSKVSKLIKVNVFHFIFWFIEGLSKYK